MNPTSKPFVSVLTPVFNGEAYLSQCIEAVLTQTHENFEYIIVDNCSSDGSLAIAKRYARTDARIRVLENDSFLDQLSNFNHAIGFISHKSKYCKFALADDLILPTCLEQMVEVAESDPDVALVGAYERALRINCQGIPFGVNVISGREACRLFLQEGVMVFGSANTILHRAEEVRARKPFFRHDDGYFEDMDVHFDILKNKKFGFVHQVLTFTRRDNVSTISTILPNQPFFLMRLMLLHRYGSHYLNDAELDREWKAALEEYLLFLGKSVLKWREKTFWRFQRRGMAKFNYSLSKRVLAGKIIAAFLGLALNPKSSATKLMRRWQETKRKQREEMSRQRISQGLTRTKHGQESMTISGSNGCALDSSVFNPCSIRGLK